MSTVVDQLMVQLGLDPSQFTAGVKAAQSALAKFEDSVKGVGDKMIGFTASATLWGTATAAAAGVAAAAIAKAGIEIGASIEDMSNQLGLSATQYRALGDNAEEAGVSMQKVTRAMMGMNNNLAQAVATGGEAADAFYKVGLNLGELAKADTNERMNLVADAIKNATSQTEKMNIATQAFGAQGARMVNWLNQGREGLEGAAEGFRAVHGAVSDISFAKLQDGRNAIGDINDVLDTMKMLFGEALTPVIIAARDEIEKFVAAKNGMVDLKTAVSDTAKTFVELAGDAGQGFNIMYNELMELVAQMGVGAWQIVKVFTQAGLIVTEVFSRPWELIQKAAFTVFASIASTITDLIGTFADLAEAAGLDSFAEKMNSVKATVAGLSKASKDAGSAIAGIDTSTPMIDQFIEDGRMIAQSYGDAAKAAEEYARTHETIGQQLVQHIEAIEDAEDAKAAAKVANDQKERSSAEETAKAQDAVRARDLEGAQKFFDQLVGMSNNAYSIMFNSEMATIAAREQARQEALAAYEQSQNQEIAALQARMDVENEIRSGSAEGRLLQEQDMNKRIMEIRVKQMEDDRNLQEASAAQWESGWRGKLDVAQDFLGQMSVLMQSNSKKMFEIGKAAAIGETIINTYKSATSAYAAMAGIPVVGPALGAAAAAAAVVAGIANVQKIQSTSFGGSGGGASSGANYGAGASAAGGDAGPAQQAPPQINRQINVSLQGNGYSADQVRSLISAINDATDDNTTLKAQVA